MRKLLFLITILTINTNLFCQIDPPDNNLDKFHLRILPIGNGYDGVNYIIKTKYTGSANPLLSSHTEGNYKYYHSDPWFTTEHLYSSYPIAFTMYYEDTLIDFSKPLIHPEFNFYYSNIPPEMTLTGAFMDRSCFCSSKEEDFIFTPTFGGRIIVDSDPTSVDPISYYFQPPKLTPIILPADQIFPFTQEVTISLDASHPLKDQVVETYYGNEPGYILTVYNGNSSHSFTNRLPNFTFSAKDLPKSLLGNDVYIMLSIHEIDNNRVGVIGPFVFKHEAPKILQNGKEVKDICGFDDVTAQIQDDFSTDGYIWQWKEADENIWNTIPMKNSSIIEITAEDRNFTFNPFQIRYIEPKYLNTPHFEKAASVISNTIFFHPAPPTSVDYTINHESCEDKNDASLIINGYEDGWYAVKYTFQRCLNDNNCEDPNSPRSTSDLGREDRFVFPDDLPHDPILGKPTYSKGKHILTVLNAEGNCSVKKIIDFDHKPAFSFDLTKEENKILCHDDHKGVISVNPIGRSADVNFYLDNYNSDNESYDFGFKSTINASDALWEDLESAKYKVRAFDAAGCAATNNNEEITINAPEAISIDHIETENESCENSKDGKIKVAASGGTGDLTYIFTPALENMVPENGYFIGVVSGGYSLVVEDGNTCSLELPGIVVGRNESITINNIATQPPTCHGGDNGSITGNIQGGSGKYEIKLNTDTEWTFTEGPISLSAGSGTYSITVRDTINRFCSVTEESVTVAPTPPVTVSTISTQPPACYGGDNGKAVITAINGNDDDDFQYALGHFSFGPFIKFDSDRTTTINGLRAGDNPITIQQGTCKSNVNVNVASTLEELKVILTHEDPICADGKGLITATGQGGNGGYSFFITNTLDAEPVADDIFPADENNQYTFNPSAGTYYVYIRDNKYDDDNKSCQSFDLITLDNPLPITANIDRHHLTCHGDESGAIYILDVQNTLGTLDITLKLDDEVIEYYEDHTFSTPLRIGDLSGGEYILIITDEICSYTNTIEVIEPSQLAFGNIIVNEPLCNEAGGGSIRVTPQGGWMGYQYKRDGNDYGDDSWFGSLSVGEYTIFIKDAGGCEIQSTVNMGKRKINILVDKEDVLCYGDNTGSIKLDITGCEECEYAFSFNGGTEESVPEFTGLAKGDYSIRVVYSAKCDSLLDPIPIQHLNPPFSATYDVIRPESFCENKKGAIEVFATGGAGPYTYGLTLSGNFKTDPVINGLSILNTVVYIKDDAQCMFELDDVDVGIEEEPVIVFEILEPAVGALPSGKVKVGVESGGTGPFLFTWTNPYLGTNPEVDGLYAGLKYHVSVTDEFTFCKIDTFIILNAAPSPSLEIQIESLPICAQRTGTLKAVVTNGNDLIQYKWFNENYELIDEDELLENKPPGHYRVEILDGSGYELSGQIYLGVQRKPYLQATGVLPSCNMNDGSLSVTLIDGVAESFQWYYGDATNNTAFADGLGAGNYRITITDTDQCMVDTVLTLGNRDGVRITEVVTKNTWCHLSLGTVEVSHEEGEGPFTYHYYKDNDKIEFFSGKAEGLSKGTYTLSVTDNHNCIDFEVFTINPNPAPVIAEERNTISYCKNPWGSAEVSGADTYEWYNQQNDIISRSAIANDLVAGTYRVVGFDSNSCPSQGIFVTISDHNILPSLEIDAVTNTYCDLAKGSAVVFMTNGIGATTYLWENGQAGSTATSLTKGYHKVTGTDSKGCSSSMLVYIDTDPHPYVEIDIIKQSACGQSIGSAVANMIGGYEPYTYTWNDPLNQSGATAIHLKAGDYLVTAKDVNDCKVVQEVAILDKEGIRITLESRKNTTCHDSEDGSATISVTGGESPYQYSWNDKYNQTTATATNLSKKTYEVKVTDEEGCEEILTVTIGGALPIILADLTTTIPTCFNGCDGQISVWIEGGNGPYTYLWDDPLALTSSRAENLCPKEYRILATDVNNCMFTEMIELANQDKLPKILDVDTATLCDGQILYLDAGDQYREFNWYLNNQVISTNRTVALGEQGQYFIEAITPLGCSNSDSLIIYISKSLLMAKFLTSSELVKGDTAVFIDVTWPQPEVLNWEYEGGVWLKSEPNQEYVIFPNSGTYQIKLIARLGECKDETTKTITVLDPGGEAPPIDGRLGYAGIESAKLYPNPNIGTFSTVVQLATPQKMHLAVYSFGNSRMIYEKEVKEANTLHEIHINIGDLPSGLYALIIRAEHGERETIKFIVL